MANMLNAEQHFSMAPVGVDRAESTMDRSHGWKGTVKAGTLNCFLYDEILPGDHVATKVSDMMRMLTPYYPVADDCFVDKFLFFVPNRLVWDHWKEFCGENNVSAWVDSTTYTIPQVTLPLGNRSIGDFAHQIGIPYNTGAQVTVSALPFRAYALIWNSWFRDENLQDPLAIDTGDTQTPYFGTASHLINSLLPVDRIHDYFGSALPGTAKTTDAVKIALSGWTNVTTSATAALSGVSSSLQWNVSATGAKATGGNTTSIGLTNGVTVANTTDAGQTLVYGMNPRNLVVDLEAANSDGDFVGVDVETLRLAVATQRILEQLAIGGSRYTEFVRSMFGVISPDARQQRPELLAYARTHVRMNEVTQNSPQLEQTGGTTTPLGTVGAYSKTVSQDLKGDSSFTEHGMLFGFFCIRHNRTYCQGLAKKFTRKNFFEFYLPQMAHLGEQPIYKREIYCDSTTFNDGSIFGYNEAWADYRYFPSIATGLLDPGVSGTLGDVWTYTDLYNAAPTLSDSWIQEGSAEIDRTLTVQGTDQFMVDMWIDYKHTRPMPMYSIPGLASHF